MMKAPQVGDTIKIYRPGMLGDGYERCVINAAYLHEDDAYDAGYTEDTGYPEDCMDWRVFSTHAPFGQIKEYAVVMAGEV